MTLEEHKHTAGLSCKALELIQGLECPSIGSYRIHNVEPQQKATILPKSRKSFQSVLLELNQKLEKIKFLIATWWTHMHLHAKTMRKTMSQETSSDWNLAQTFAVYTDLSVDRSGPSIGGMCSRRLSPGNGGTGATHHLVDLPHQTLLVLGNVECHRSTIPVRHKWTHEKKKHHLECLIQEKYIHVYFFKYIYI